MSQAASGTRQEKARLLAASIKSYDEENKRLINDDDDDDDEEEEKDDGSTLIIAFLLMLVFSLGNRIFGKLVTYPMHNYPLYMNLLCTGLYVPMCFLYIAPVQLFTNRITKETTGIPKSNFAVMGCLDSLSSIMAVFAVNYISNASLIVLVQQSAIPISMLISKITLNARYTHSQYIGAGVVLSGIVLVLLPTFFTTGTTTPGESNEVLWLVLLVISCVPMCLSSVYKEKALGEVDIDVVYLNGWVAIFQTICAIPLCLPSATVTGLAVTDILPNLYGGLMCSFGVNTVTEATSSLHVDECSSGPLFVSIYLFFNIFYNLLIVIILKHGSANILWMASTVIVPLSNVAFSLKITPGHKPLNTMDIVGLVVIMSGLVVYRFTAQLQGLWMSITQTLTAEEAAIRKLAKRIGMRSEKKQTKLIGLNQIEALNAMIDSRVMTAQRAQLFRSPAQVRGELLLKLGIPPSPMISLGPAGRYQDLKSEARQPAFSPQMMPKFKSPRAARNAQRNAAGSSRTAGIALQQQRPNEV